jgi:hypothetical protein
MRVFLNKDYIPCIASNKIIIRAKFSVEKDIDKDGNAI